jgi:hypothetical protein
MPETFAGAANHVIVVPELLHSAFSNDFFFGYVFLERTPPWNRIRNVLNINARYAFF